MTPTLEQVRAAAARIAGAVRRTPMMLAGPSRLGRYGGSGGHEPPVDDRPLLLKLECLQVSGSFKARGALNKLRSLDPELVRRGLVTASGGNHGLGVAYAAWRAKVPAVVVLPSSAPESKADALRGWGADVLRAGAVWDEANEHALSLARERGLTHVHPFADADVIAGQGTLGLELDQDAPPELAAVHIAIGGGGLIAGVATTLRALRPGLRIVGVEPEGAPTLRASLAAGECVTLERIATRAGTLAPRRTHPGVLEAVRRSVDDVVLVSDAEMEDAARRLWREYGLGVELAGAAALAAVLAGRGLAGLPPGAPVCALVCGAGDDGVRAPRA